MAGRKRLSEGDVSMEDLDGDQELFGLEDHPGSGSASEDFLDDIDAEEADEDSVMEVDGVRKGVRTKVGRSSEETLFAVLHEEDKQAKKRLSKKRKERKMRQEKLSRENVFLNLDPEQRKEKIKEICTLKLNSEKMSVIFGHARKLQPFIAQIVKKEKINWQKLGKEQKIALLKEHGVKNSAWLSYLNQTVRLCFPLIEFYSTRCNPVEFGNIVFEELLVPVTNLKSAIQINAWYSNNGNGLEQKMQEKMTELLQIRLK